MVGQKLEKFDPALWEPIAEFPIYLVSVYGDVANGPHRRILNTYVNARNYCIVTLQDGPLKFTRPVGHLVARAFLPIPEDPDVFSSIIQKDGNRVNNRADNLAWRPRWFAMKYFRQFDKFDEFKSKRTVITPVIEVNSGFVYQDTFDAALSNGLLEVSIRSSIHTGNPVPITGQTFEYIED